MKSPELNDVIHNSHINALGFKTTLKTKHDPSYSPPPPLHPKFQIEHFTFYETSDNALFE